MTILRRCLWVLMSLSIAFGGAVLRAAGLVVCGLIAWSMLRALNRAMGFPWPWRYLF